MLALTLLLTTGLQVGAAGVVQDPDPDGRVPTEPETEPPPPNEPRPEPEPEPEPQPEPEPEPRPAPEPTPAPPDDPETGEPPDRPGEDRDEPRVGASPFGELGTANRQAQIVVGGDLLFGPKCRGESTKCNGGRLGARGKFAVTESSGSGASRTSIDALNGFAGPWRVGLIGDFIRDTTEATGPAKFWMLTAGVEWGVQTFSWIPQGQDDERSRTRHSFDVLGRYLHYIHAPRRYRVAPQILVRYARDWGSADTVGVLEPGPDGGPDIAVDRIIEGPASRPAFVVTVPVLFSIQRGGRVLPQLGFGPALSWASVGSEDSYQPFGAVHTVRAESWLYWYPAGTNGLEAQKANVRIGVAPFLDVFVQGREPGAPQVNPGALIEVRVGVRGYEY